MAVKAFMTLESYQPGSSTSAFTPLCKVCVLGSYGDLPNPVFNYTMSEYTAGDLALTLNSAFTAEIKQYLLDNNVPFGLLNTDTVRLTNPIS